MGLKETVLGWFRSTPDKDKDLEAAEIDKRSDEYGVRRGDVETDLRTRSNPGEFESDQDAPRR
jgi:hypothetical protein